MDTNTTIKAEAAIFVQYPENPHTALAGQVDNYQFPTERVLGMPLTQALGHIFMDCNHIDTANWFSTHPVKARSMSVGDVVIVQQDRESTYWLVAGVGFRQISHRMSRAWKRISARDASFDLDWLIEKGLVPVLSEGCVRIVLDLLGDRVSDPEAVKTATKGLLDSEDCVRAACSQLQAAHRKATESTKVS